MEDRAKRGRRYSCLKLTPEQVKAIRAASGTGRAIAKRFCVTEGLISMIRNNRIWKHL